MWGELSDPEPPAGTPSSVPRMLGTDPSLTMTLQTARTSATQDMLRCEHAGPSDLSGHVSTKEQPFQRIPFRLETKHNLLGEDPSETGLSLAARLIPGMQDVPTAR